jgi:hypothetical protein
MLVKDAAVDLCSISSFKKHPEGFISEDLCTALLYNAIWPVNF